MSTNETSRSASELVIVQTTFPYSVKLWLCICTFLGILFVSRVFSSLVYCLRRRRIIHETDDLTGYQKVVHTVVNVFRIIMYRVTIPTGYYQWSIAESCVVLGYLVLLLVWEFIKSYDPTIGPTLDIQYWSIRAGVVVVNQLPLLQALSGKNNIISLMVGISHEKLQIFHRVLGRITLCCAWFHFCSQIGLGLSTFGLATKWIFMGIIAASSYTLLFLLSVYPFRKRYYEVFIWLHVILSGLVVMALYFHVSQSTRLDGTMVPLFIFWAVDRTIRLLRVGIIHVRSRNGETKEMDKVQLVSDSLVLITLHRKMTWKAGQSAFLTLPSISRFPFEAHPFTIATLPDTPHEKASDSPKELFFIVRVKDGFTKRLFKAAATAGGCPIQLPLALVDGPYGIPPDVDIFKNVILIAGGSGVSFTLPLFQKIVRNTHEKGSLCRSLAFYWVIAHYEDLNCIASRLLEILHAAPQSCRLHLHFFISRPFMTSEQEGTNLRRFLSELLTHEFVTIEMIKPNVRDFLSKETEYCTGSTLVAVAGPTSLANDVRYTLGPGLHRIRQLNGMSEIYLHVETGRIS